MFAPRDISLVIISSIIFILQKKETIQKKRRSFVFIISFFFTRGAPRLWRGSCVDVSFTHINFYFSASWLGPLRLFVPNVEQNTKSRLYLYTNISQDRDVGVSISPWCTRLVCHLSIAPRISSYRINHYISLRFSFVKECTNGPTCA